MIEDITNDLALLDDWLAGKGYGEEAGLCLRAMDLIRKQVDEIERLRALFKVQSDEHRNHVRGLNAQWDKEHDLLCSEITKLRHQLNAEKEQAREDVSYFDALRAENEKLQSKCEFIYDELLGAKGQVEKLRAALKPFSKEAAMYADTARDEVWVSAGLQLKVYRAAKAALGESDDLRS